MSEIKKYSGSCLCGAVRFDVGRIESNIGACHCRNCRKWGGGPFMEIECGPNVTFEGKKNISVYDSSKWAERGFCNKCGSHLFIRTKENNEYGIPAGLFNNDLAFIFNRQVFIDLKPPYYSFSDNTRDIDSEYICKVPPVT